MAQGLGVCGRGNKLVTAGDQTPVHSGLRQPQRMQGNVLVHVDERSLYTLLHPLGQLGRRVQATAPQTWQLVPGKQRRRVHVVLDQGVGHNHIAHAHLGTQATGHTGEPDLRDPEGIGQQSGRDGGCHLADAGEGHHHLAPMQVTAPENASAAANRGLIGHQVDEGLQFLRHGGHQADRPDRAWVGCAMRPARKGR